MGRRLEQVIAALNGAVGDHLARSGNGLAIGMELLSGGRPLPLERGALARALPGAGPRPVVFAHGLMTDESVWRFADGSGDYGTRLQAELGMTPLHLRFNSGLAIADNGRLFAERLEALAAAWPVAIEELLLVGFSMGGLLVRSACHHASERGMAWLPKVRRAVYVGTPHRGAPLERAGRALAWLLEAVPDPWTRLLGELGNLRSEGLQDLGDADLRHQDRVRPRPHFSLRDAHHPVPLLPQIRHCLIAGTLSADPLLAALFGDALVPVPSGTFAARPPGAAPIRVQVLPGVSHLALAHHPGVWDLLRAFCEEER